MVSSINCDCCRHFDLAKVNRLAGATHSTSQGYLDGRPCVEGRGLEIPDKLLTCT